jgi:aminoglycoside phosphotransferase family enzyme/predicted kinase
VSHTLRDDLMRAGALPPGKAPTECRETHISWVFLTDSEAWKVKKPVDLGFLDFRTLASRKAACEAEVNLNARLAPGVYLGVFPIRRGADGAHHAALGEGEIVDWAVRMKRLPDARRADILLSRGHLEPAVVDRLAVHIARFHEKANCSPEIERYGAPASVEESVRENFSQTRAAIGNYLSAKQALEIERWQTDFLLDHASLFEERARAGRVRDGHGDLRLEHVYVGPGDEFTVLDCIEFNERFRFADVCSDLAFLSMDLAWNHRVDLAERLLARYAREANDHDLYSVVDFYESYRAYVRGKISTMLAEEASVPEEVRARAAHEARRYFLLALSADRRSLLAPSLVAVGGWIASGKSTVADWLSAELGAPIVDADRTRKHMLGMRATDHAEDDAWKGAYDPSFTEDVYAEVLRRASVVLASGRPVIVDASFRSVHLRQATRSLAEKHGVPFQFIECRATADTCRARLAERARGETVSDGRLAVFDQFSSRFEPVTDLPPAQHVVIDTEQPPEAVHAAVRRSISTWPRGLVA